MAKLLNRAIRISGELKKVGTPVVRIVRLDWQGNVSLATGATLPTNGDAGYAVGCIFTKTTGQAGATGYINEGSTSSSTFNSINAAGGTGYTTWDALYGNDVVLAITGTTLTFDGQHATNDVITLTQTGAGSGSLLQITNVGTGKDIRGTSGTWDISKLGAITGLSVVLAGTAATTSFTMTLGNAVISAGGLAITKATDTATLSVTNNSSAASSAIVIASSGTYTGNTTTSFMTITPSGLTSGTAVYLPVAALTTGKALHIVANAYSDGLVFNLTSSSTASTSTGRLFNLAHTATSNVNHIIAEMATAAQDETILLKLTASDALALGKILQVSGASLTTGFAIDLPDLAVLTSGIAIKVVSSATAITGAGRLLSVYHSGVTTSTGTIVEFKTDATDAANATTLLALTMGASIVGVGLSIASTTGMTTGSLIRATTSSAGLVATNGIISFSETGNFTSTSGIAGGFVQIAANTTTAGTVVNVLGTALTTGVAVSISNGTAATTSGSLLRVAAGGIGAVATNGIVSFTHTGIYTSTSAVDGGFVEIKANSTTAGTVLNVVGSGLTTGIGLQLSNGTSAMTSGSLLRITASGTGTVATNGIVSITHGGIFVSTSNAGVLDVRASAMVGTASNGTLVNFMTTAAAQVNTTVLNVENSGFTTGYTGTMLRITSPTTTGAATLVGIIGNGITSGGTAMSISVTALTTGTGLVITASGGTAAITTGSLLSVTTDGTGAIATNGIVSFTHTGAFTSTSSINGGFVEVKAASTTAGTIVNLVGAGLTTGILLSLSNGTAATTTGSLIRATAGGVGAVATNGIYSFFHTGIYTSTSAQIGMFHISASATTAGTVASIVGAAVVGGTILSLNAVAATLTTGKYLEAFDGTNTVFAVKLGGHLASAGTAPTVAAGAGAGTGPTGPAVTAGSTDTKGNITVTIGTPTGVGTIATITFAKAYASAPLVILTPATAATAAEMVTSKISTTSTTTTFTIVSTTTGLTQATAFSFNYVCIE